MPNEVAVLEPRDAVVITSEQTELIKRTICQGATDQEMKLYFYDCTRRGVHPLDKLIHFTKRSGKYTPITSIDFMRQRASASNVFAGEEEPVYTYMPSGAVDTCKYTVYRLVQGQRYKWTATARWDEYYPGDQLGFIWKKMPTLMLAKCAEALALRKAFPAELQGLYVKEEMDQAGPIVTKGQPMPYRLDEAPETTPPTELETQLKESIEQVEQRKAPSVFDESSAIADHEINLDAATNPEQLQAAWDDVVKDKRLSSETRAPLYKRMTKLAGGMKGKKP